MSPNELSPVGALQTTVPPSCAGVPAYPAAASERPRRPGRPNRARWAAIGAAVAVALGGGGLMTASAAVDSGDRAVYVPITPCRVMDTRPAPETVGPRATPIGAGETHTIQITGTNGNCTIPADAVGVVMNVAAITPTAGSFLTVFPADQSRPLAANLNWVANQPPVSNAVTADLSADGRVSFYNLGGTVHVAADIVGYYVGHTHDDRYYTETEIDTRLAAGTVRAYATINPNGASSIVSARSKGFLTVTRSAAGIYCLTLDPATGIDARTVTPVASGEYGNTVALGHAMVRAAATNCGGGADDIEIRTFNAAGAVSDAVAFTVLVP